MKLLTLNAHALLEADYERKLVCFAEYVLREQVDLIALQEVNQSVDAPEAEEWLLEGRYPAEEKDVPIRADNHAAWAAFLLRQAGMIVSWVWLPVKRGYGRFDEGLAILSINRPIAGTEAHLISRTDEYLNWRRRKILGVRLGGMNDWFYTVHTGWWQDEEEPFAGQWRRLEENLQEKKEHPVWLMGDFNCPAENQGEGYDLIRASGWHDLYLAAKVKRGCATVRGEPDGWKGRNKKEDGLRIDYIFCSRPALVKSARVVFDGEHEKQVSDHFGVLVETEINRRSEL